MKWRTLSIMNKTLIIMAIVTCLALQACSLKNTKNNNLRRIESQRIECLSNLEKQYWATKTDKGKMTVLKEMELRALTFEEVLGISMKAPLGGPIKKRILERLKQMAQKIGTYSGWSDYYWETETDSQRMYALEKLKKTAENENSMVYVSRLIEALEEKIAADLIKNEEFPPFYTEGGQ